MARGCRSCSSPEHSTARHNEAVRKSPLLIAASNKYRTVFKDAEDHAAYKPEPGTVTWSQQERSYIGWAVDGKEVLLPSAVEQCERYLADHPDPATWW